MSWAKWLDAKATAPFCMYARVRMRHIYIIYLLIFNTTFANLKNRIGKSGEKKVIAPPAT